MLRHITSLRVRRKDVTYVTGYKHIWTTVEDFLLFNTI